MQLGTIWNRNPKLCEPALLQVLARGRKTRKQRETPGHQTEAPTLVEPSISALPAEAPLEPLEVSAELPLPAVVEKKKSEKNLEHPEALHISYSLES